MKRILIFALLVAVCVVSFSQEDDCFEHRVSEGDRYFRNKNYASAFDYYSEAKNCVEKPADLSFLDKKIKRAKKLLSKTLVKIFEVSKKSVKIPQKGGAGRIDFTSKNVGLPKLENSLPSWLEVKIEKDAIVWTARENKTFYKNEHTIYLKAKDKSQEIKFVQFGIEKAQISLSQNSLTFYADHKGEKSVSVSVSNTRNDFQIRNVPNWVNVRRSGNDVFVSVSKNWKTKERNAMILFDSKDASNKLYVKQYGRESWMRLEKIGFRTLVDLELTASFELPNADYLQFDAGLWNFYNLSGGVSASYVWTLDFSDSFRLFYGAGLGFGGKRKYYFGENTFLTAVVPSVGIEYKFYSAPIGLSLDYRPFIGTNFQSFYHNFYNFNFGVSYFFDLE